MLKEKKKSIFNNKKSKRSKIRIKRSNKIFKNLKRKMKISH